MKVRTPRGHTAAPGLSRWPALAFFVLQIMNKMDSLVLVCGPGSDGGRGVHLWSTENLALCLGFCFFMEEAGWVLPPILSHQAGSVSRHLPWRSHCWKGSLHHVVLGLGASGDQLWSLGTSALLWDSSYLGCRSCSAVANFHVFILPSQGVVGGLSFSGTQGDREEHTAHSSE